MSRMRLIVALFVLVVAPAGPAVGDRSRQDETSIVTLDDGHGFEGRRLGGRRDQVVYDTPFGERELAAERIVAERPAADLRARYEALRNALVEPQVADRVELARWCLTRGLSSGLAEQLEAILEREPDQAWAWTTLAALAPDHRVTERNPQPEGKGRWDRTQADLSYRALRDGGWVKGALIRLQLDALPVEAQINEAVRNAERGGELQRWVAVQTLQRAEPVRRVKTLYRTVLGDDCWQVRLMALRSLQRHDDGSTYRPFVRALLKQGNNDALRMNAAWALGRLGDRRAVPALVRALKATDGPRVAHANISNLTQIAYVKDYDVEVAQTAFIADPVVDVVIDGFVLDVAVVGIERQREILGTALGRITGRKLAAEPGVWADWWRTKGKDFLAGSGR
ncbi:MAG: HEAT repeat domain-containing protein [Planctomycetes bacterium]|nr:HEAT repeat domain-containing protein [Planctomycetota bacterium]